MVFRGNTINDTDKILIMPTKAENSVVSVTLHVGLIINIKKSLHNIETVLQNLFFKHQRRKSKIAEFANNVGLDEVAHYEPPHLDPHCLSSSL